MLRAAVTAVVIAIGSLVLAGCWVAREPVLTKENADYPFVKLKVQIGNDRDVVTLVRSGDVYVFEEDRNNPGPAEYFLFKRVSEGLYISQETFPQFNNMNVYAIIRHEGELLKTPYCGNYSQAKLDKYGIVVLKGDKLGDIIHGKPCQVQRLEQLVGLSSEEPDGTEKIRTAKIVAAER